MSFWLSMCGLGFLLFGWSKALWNLLTDKDIPPEWNLPRNQEPEALPRDDISLSILIPARNEEHNIEKSVMSALGQDWPGPLEVVVVDDRSTDETPNILKSLQDTHENLIVVGGDEPTSGWLGKPHALHQAQGHAKGDWLWFVDADVELDPLGARRLVGRTISHEAQMSSGLGQLEVESFWEKTIQTRMGAVIAGGNPLHEVNDPEHERALANGQCLLFKRTAYDAMGGHEAIKGSVLDDVDFAKKAKTENVPYRLFYAPGVFSCRMYTGFSEIWQGWTKNLFPALGYSFVTTAIVTILLFLVSLLPFVLVGKNMFLLCRGVPIESSFIVLESLICILILGTDGIGHAVRGYDWRYFWSFPLGMFLILCLFWNSALRIGSGRGATWKGRLVESGQSYRNPTRSSEDEDPEQEG